MYVRDFTFGDEPALQAVFYSAIHTIAASDYTPTQLDAWPAGLAARAHGSGCPDLSSLPATHNSAPVAATSAGTAASKRYFMRTASGATATQFRVVMATALSAVIASWREPKLNPHYRVGAPHSRAIRSDVLAKATAGADHSDGSRTTIAWAHSRQAAAQAFRPTRVYVNASSASGSARLT